MRVRGLLATTALAGTALLVPAATAQDEAPESCLLVEDDLNDTQYQGRDETRGTLVHTDVDLVSGDVATDDDTLYAVIRVQDLRTTGLALRGETRYRLEFSAGSRRYYVQVPTGYPVVATTGRYYWPWATAGRVGGRPHDVGSYVDYWNDEIVVSAPLTVFGRAGIPAGTRLNALALSAVRTYTDTGQVAPGVSGKVVVSDGASSIAEYVAGTPSCVEPDPWWEPAPTVEPTPPPTEEPSPSPTEPAPTGEPTEPAPTGEPTPAPTAEPTAEPTGPAPTGEPTGEPTPGPTGTADPSGEPTNDPTAGPSEQPTGEPTPTEEPGPTGPARAPVPPGAR